MGKKKDKMLAKLESLQNIPDIESEIAELDKKIELVDEQLKNGTFKSKEEYRESEVQKKNLEKDKNELVIFNKNKEKINNILEYKKQLTDEIKELEESSKIFAKRIELNIEVEKLTNELNELQEEKTKVYQELKNPKISEEEKSKLLQRKAEIGKQIDENNIKFSKNQSEFAKIINMKDEDPTKEIEIKKQKIAKCNMIWKNLLLGKNWDEIGLKLDAMNKEYTENNKKSSLKEKMEKIMKETAEELDLEPEEQAKEQNSLIIKESFAEKHPRLAKIGNFFKKAFNKITRKEKKEEVVEKPEEETINGEEEKINFKDELREWQKIANKGIKEEVKPEKMAKYQEAKKAAAEHYASEYGGKYNKQDGVDR